MYILNLRYLIFTFNLLTIFFSCRQSKIHIRDKLLIYNVRNTHKLVLEHTNKNNSLWIQDYLDHLLRRIYSHLRYLRIVDLTVENPTKVHIRNTIFNRILKENYIFLNRQESTGSKLYIDLFALPNCINKLNSHISRCYPRYTTMASHIPCIIKYIISMVIQFLLCLCVDGQIKFVITRQDTV